MKVLLPSHGILGQSKVNMRVPTFGDLRDIQSYNKDDVMRKYKFVEMLTDADLSKITVCDADYLFTIAAGALVYNIVNYSVTCPHCGNKIDTRVGVLDKEIKELLLDKGSLPFSKRINGKKYEFTILSAQQVLDAYDWSQYQDNPDTAFEDAQVALILGKGLDSVSFVRKLPISVYLGAFIFQRMYRHGLVEVESVTCPHCGKSFEFTYKVSSSILEFDISTMMSRFAPVSDRLSFESFLRMSIIDFNAYISELNKYLDS